MDSGGVGVISGVERMRNGGVGLLVVGGVGGMILDGFEVL